MKMLEANTIIMPISTSVVYLILSNSTNLKNTTKYHQVIRNLQYLTFTHSDITYAVNKLS